MKNRIPFLMLAIWALLAGVVAGGESEPPSQSPKVFPKSSGTLILNETTYSRQYVQFGVDRVSPAQLKAPQTAQLLSDKRGGRGSTAMDTLKGEVKTVLGFMGKKWDDALEKGGWMDEAYVLYRQCQAWVLGEHGRMNVQAARVPPPANWMAPEFDDLGWSHLQGSLVVGAPGAGNRDDVQELGRKAIFVRYRFEVPDPAKAGELTLKLVYRGGARVFLNGKELARGHLPGGEITPETRGADYPLEAYAPLNEDGSLMTYGAPRLGKNGCPFFVSDLYGKFDDAAPATESKNPNMRMARPKEAGRWCDRKNWERLQGLRDRVIGPVALPANLLKKGSNVLAVEIRVSDLHPVAGGYSVWRDPFANQNYHHGAWFHAQVVKLELTATGGGVPSMRVRRPGVQVWVEDIHHRVISSEYSETGDATGTLRFVTPVNGEFSGQVIVGTDKELKGLTAAATDLQRAGGAETIPGSALTIARMAPHALPELAPLRYSGSETSRGGATYKIKPGEARELLTRYGPVGLDVEKLKPEEALKEIEKISFFDHIGAAAPAAVPAGTCQPLWVTLKAPANAPAGLYKGSLRVEAEGMKPVMVPVEAEVIGWRMPDTKDWQQVIQIEQSPYGVAEHYKAGLWSEEHFKLMEASFKELGRIGDKWLFVPVLQNTELGNRADSMLKWIRRKDGTLAFDYTAMDRYIDLAVKYWGKPRIICFLVMHGGAANTTITVPLLDEAKGETVIYDVSNKSPKYREDWQVFGKALYAHMKAKGLLDSMYFGYRWDGDGDPGLSVVLSTVAPGVPWASGSHGYAVPPQYTCESRIYNLAYGTGIVKGWKRSNILLLNPRGGGTVIEVTGQSDPALFRILPDRALMAGCNGIARIAADYWESVYFRGCKAWQYLIPGMAINSWMLWPGPNGAEGSQRLEVLKEGLEEAEARIYIEQALDQGGLPPELAKKAVEALDNHERENYFIPMSSSQAFIPFFMDWQGRARRLFAVAAETAALGFDLEKPALAAEIPAFGTRQVSWRIRNWVATPIDWKAETDVSWITLSKTAGKLNGHEEFSVLLDGAQVAPEAKAEGKVTFTAGDRTRVITIAVHASKVMEYTPIDNASPLPYVPDKGHVVFNTPAGAAQSQEFTVLNQSAKELSWKCTGDLAWVKVEPAAGKAAPQSGITLKVTAAPPDEEAAFYKGMLTLTDENSPAKVAIPLAVHVIPEYRKPNLPQAVRVFPFDANPRIDANPVLKACHTQGYAQWGASQLGSHDAAFNIEGKRFKAFSAEVSVPKVWSTSGFSGETADFFGAVFEVIVDGRIRASSGIMKPQGGLGFKDKGDMEKRLLVVEGLEGAKELVLSGRFTTLPGAHQALVWNDPKLYSDAKHHVPAAHAADAMVYIDPGSASPLPNVPDRGSVVFNVPAGTAHSVEFTVFNQSAKELSWKCASDLPYLRVEPAAGKAAPDSDIALKATAAPPDKEAAFLKGTLTLTDENSQAKLSIPVAVHVIPEYQKPNLPQAAKAVPFDGKAALKAHHNVHGQPAQAWGGFEMGSHAAVFNIEGKNFKAFSAEVSVPKVWSGEGYNGTTEDNCQAVFEILVDGKVRTSSGAMKPQGGGGKGELEKRLLVVEGLSGAKELTLSARFLTLPDKFQGLYWDEQKVYPE